VADLARVMPWGNEEAEFVSELQAGSEAAFDSLVAHYQAAVYQMVYSMVGDAADAADVTQEVFLKAFRGMRSFQRGSSLKTWLYRIAVCEALNQRRWWRRHLRWQFSLDGPAGESQAARDVQAAEPTPYDRFATRELQAIVRRALAAMPAVFRSAVVLRDLEGLSYEEVAEVLQVSVGTVKSRILRGRRALRKILDPVLRGRGAAAEASPAEASRVAASASEAALHPVPVYVEGFTGSVSPGGGS